MHAHGIWRNYVSMERKDPRDPAGQLQVSWGAEGRCLTRHRCSEVPVWPAVLLPRLLLSGSASSGQASFIYTLPYVHLFIAVILIRAEYSLPLLPRF